MAAILHCSFVVFWACNRKIYLRLRRKLLIARTICKGRAKEKRHFQHFSVKIASSVPVSKGSSIFLRFCMHTFAVLMRKIGQRSAPPPPPWPTSGSLQLIRRPRKRQKRQKSGILFYPHSDAVRLHQLIEPSFDAAQFAVDFAARARITVVSVGQAHAL